jgi:hypothetical protein
MLPFFSPLQPTLLPLHVTQVAPAICCCTSPCPPSPATLRDGCKRAAPHGSSRRSRRVAATSAPSVSFHPSPRPTLPRFRLATAGCARADWAVLFRLSTPFCFSTPAPSWYSSTHYAAHTPAALVLPTRPSPHAHLADRMLFGGPCRSPTGATNKSAFQDMVVLRLSRYHTARLPTNIAAAS